MKAPPSKNKNANYETYYIGNKNSFDSLNSRLNTTEESHELEEIAVEMIKTKTNKKIKKM